jgi:hypothetical protein
MDFPIQRILSSYKKKDPPESRQTHPVQVLRRIMAIAHAAPMPGNLAIAEMCSIAFFYLLCPGDYTLSPSESTPYRLCDVQLRVGNHRLVLLLATDADIRSVTFATLPHVYDTEERFAQ